MESFISSYAFPEKVRTIQRHRLICPHGDPGLTAAEDRLAEPPGHQLEVIVLANELRGLIRKTKKSIKGEKVKADFGFQKVLTWGRCY